LTGEDVPIGGLAAMVEEASGTPAPRRRVPLTVALAAARAEALLARLTGRPPRAPLTGVRLAARPCRFDNRHAVEALGFTPRPVRDCVREAVEWLAAENANGSSRLAP